LSEIVVYFYIAGLSAMIAGADNGSTFIVKNYQETDASDIFKNFFS
jgi:hypothetical protein